MRLERTEEIAATHVFEYKVDAAGVLKGVVQRDDEGVPNVLHRDALADDRLGRAWGSGRGRA